MWVGVWVLTPPPGSSRILPGATSPAPRAAPQARRTWDWASGMVCLLPLSTRHSTTLPPPRITTFRPPGAPPDPLEQRPEGMEPAGTTPHPWGSSRGPLRQWGSSPGGRPLAAGGETGHERAWTSSRAGGPWPVARGEWRVDALFIQPGTWDVPWGAWGVGRWEWRAERRDYRARSEDYRARSLRSSPGVIFR